MINKQKILDNLKNDMRSADNLRLDTVKKVEQWKKEYNGEPYGNEEKNKSKIVSRDIKRQDEWQHASLKDPFLSSANIVKCVPITAEDASAAEQNELVLNYQFTRKFDRYNFITDAIKVLTTEGTLVVKTFWDYKDEILKEKFPLEELDEQGNLVTVGTEEVEVINVLENKPNAEVCRIEDVYIDPTCQGNLDNCQFIIHRFESDMSSLLLSKKYKKSLLAKVGKSLEGNSSSHSSSAENDFENEDETEFEFKDVARKKLLVHEYWGNYDIEGNGIAKPIVCTWVGDVMIRLEDNPYPDKKIPFLIVKNNSIPFQMTGEANAEMIGDNQKLSTAIKRGAVDNMANSNNTQKGIKVGGLSGRNRTRFLNGQNFEFNYTKDDFYEGSYNQLPQSMFQMLDLINNETESITGIKGFAGGINGAGLGSTATSARGALDAVSVRRLDIVKNIAENLIKPLMRKWIAYNSEFLSENEIIRVTNNEFTEIRRDDLKGYIDIDIEVSTAEDDSKKGQELAFLLQTMGPNMDQGMVNMVMSKIAKLAKMPDLAEQMANYQPQPDPLAMEIRQLERDKLISEIEERRTRSQENIVDADLKRETIRYTQARIRNLDGNSDMDALDFVEKASGVSNESKDKK